MDKKIDNNEVQLWSHRGYKGYGAQESSIGSLDDAVKVGYKSIEFDIWYFKEGGLRIKHDLPSLKEIQTLPTLDDYFKYGNQLKYWLDWKNLSEDNIDEALKELSKIINKNNIKQENLYFAPFEHNIQKALGFCQKAKLLFPKMESMILVKKFPKQGLNYLYHFLRENNINNISIKYTKINEMFMKTFYDFNIFAWTVNESEDFNRLVKMGVRNICTDDITYQNFNIRSL